MNSNERNALLSTNNNQQVVTHKEVILVNSEAASAYYCARFIVLTMILIGFIVGLVYIIKNNI
jgi:hypothetical protein